MKRDIYTSALFLLVFGMAPMVLGEYRDEAGVQVLTRGPMHEAFAAASMTGATAGVVISQPPYESIDELPPDQRPEGANIAWIPGYWSWDDDRSDYIWISGVWRDVPPNRQWVPGYWATVGDGVQWISGFWGEVAQTEVTYLPAPPEPLEVGPSSPAPAPDHVWSSGSWVWQQTRYHWQPGYWVVQRPDWVWTPAYYTWTPRGHVFVPGYWDYDLVNRGVMFAPIYYDQPVYRQPSYHYSPRIVIDLGVIVASLFVRPRSQHYYYGDYYDPRYESRGFYPWYSAQASRYGPDPIYMHYRSRQLVHNPNWDTYVVEQYRYRREHVAARPPQTFALQVNIINNARPGAEHIVIGRSLNEAIRGDTHSRRFTAVNKEERQQMETRGRDIRQLQSKRAEIETAPDGAGRARGVRGPEQPVRMQLPTSPVAARPVDEARGDRRPPPRPEESRLQPREGQRGQERPQRVDTTTGPPASRAQPVRATSGAPGQSDRSKDQPVPTRGRAPQTDRPEAATRQPATGQPATRGRAPQTTTAPRTDRPEAATQQPAARQPATRGRAPQEAARQERRPEQPAPQAQRRQDETEKTQSGRERTREVIKRYKGR